MPDAVQIALILSAIALLLLSRMKRTAVRIPVRFEPARPARRIRVQIRRD
jgi:hypothetical protein